MKEKVKSFWEKHGIKVVIVGTATCAIATGYVAHMIKLGVDFNKTFVNLKKLDGSPTNFERVLEILKLNDNVNTRFMAIKDPTEITGYAILTLDDRIKLH